MTNEAGGHLDDDVILSIVEDKAEPEVRRRVEAHAAGCATCRELLSALARQLDASPTATTLRATPVAADTEPRAGGADAMPGRVGRYVLERALGAGGMGVVYTARDPELDRIVAVKLLRRDAVDDESRLAMEDRLRREARAMAKLSHPNVVAVYDVGVHGDRVFVAMEYVEGATLAKWLDTPRSLGEILELFRGAGQGLAAAHAQGVVHRDFKPSNVLVGSDGRPRVGDFGIAKLGPGGGKLSSGRAAPATVTNAALGTPYYMAPEQYLGEPVDARADQFSFCVALYAALHGVRPFAGTTLDEIAATVLARKLTPPPDPARVPARIQAAIVRGLSPVPGERFPTMAALLAELVVALPRWRRRVAIGAAITAAAALGATAFAMTRPAPHAPEPAHDFTLPAIVDAPRTKGPARVADFVERPGADHLGSRVFAAAWCAPRGSVVLVTAYGRVASVARDGTVTTLGSFPISTRADGTAVTCLPSGRIVGVVRGTSFVLDGATPRVASTAPDNVIDVVAVGDTAHWVTRGALWAWNGTAPATKLRASCEHPLRIAPDGNRVACARDQRIVVDTGTGELDGPVGERASWAHDGRSLFVTSAGVVRRWWLAEQRDAEIVATGIDAVDVGSWLIAKNHSELVRAWLGKGPAPALPLLDLGARGDSATLVAPLPPDRVVVVYGERGVRVVPLDQPAGDLPPDAHLSPILALAFSADAQTLYSLDADGFTIARSRDDALRRLAGKFPDALGGEPLLVARSDGTLVIAGQRMVGVVDAAHRFSAWQRFGFTFGPVVGTDDLIAATMRDGISELLPDGRPGATRLAGPLQRGLSGVAVDVARRFALLRVGTDLLQVVGLPSGRVVFSVTVRGKTVQRVALAGGEPVTIAIADTAGQLFSASAAGIVPLFRVGGAPITALAASPADHRVAIGGGREVVMIDLDRSAEIGYGTLDSTVTALAWSHDGHQLAAAGASTEIAIWRLP